MSDANSPEKAGDIKKRSTSVKKFEDHDVLNRKEFCENLTKKLIDVYNNRIDKDHGYSMSLNGDYGSGKTWFLEMWMNYLKSQKDENANFYKPNNIAYLNIWEDEIHGSPLLSLSYELCNLFGLKNPCKGLLSKINRISLSYAGFGVGIGITGEKLNKERKDLKNLKKSIKEEIEERTKKESPIIIFIDELDRVKPPYALQVLETVKHFFDIPGIIFIFAVNKSTLINSIKHHYGNDFDIEGYYKRFFLHEEDLTITGQDYNCFANNLYENVLNKSLLAQREESDRKIIDEIAYLCHALNMSLRDMNHLFSAIFYYNQQEGWGKYQQQVCSLLILLLSLKAKKPREFEEIGKVYEISNLDKDEIKRRFGDFIKTLMSLGNEKGCLDSLNYFFIRTFLLDIDKTIGRELCTELGIRTDGFEVEYTGHGKRLYDFILRYERQIYHG